jgi:uncharacterized membrane protein
MKTGHAAGHKKTAETAVFLCTFILRVDVLTTVGMPFSFKHMTLYLLFEMKISE